jgi:hypothetical protein
MLTDAGSLETASYMWQSLYEESTDNDIRRNAQLHLACLLVDRQIPMLESLVSTFRNRFGRNPRSWTEIVSEGLLRMVPRDPMGQPYILRDDGRVVVSDPKSLPFIREGNPA